MPQARPAAGRGSAAAALLAVVLGGACSPAAAPARVEAKPDTPLPGTGSRPVEVLDEGPAGRLVRHAAGTTRVPLQPRRIVALNLADEVLALGLQPVGEAIGWSRRFDAYLEPLLEGTRALGLGTSWEPDLEGVLACAPDLILVQDAHGLKQLERIAPTVVLDHDELHYRERLRSVAAVLGRASRAEEVLAAHERLLDAARRRLASVGDRSFAVFRIHSHQYRVAGLAGTMGSILYQDLRLRAPRFVAENGRGRPILRMPLEEVADLDADQILLILDPTVGTERVLSELRDSPLWRRVPAVAAGRVHPVDVSHWAGSGILGRQRAFADVLEAVFGRGGSPS